MDATPTYSTRTRVDKWIIIGRALRYSFSPLCLYVDVIFRPQGRIKVVFTGYFPSSPCDPSCDRSRDRITRERFCFYCGICACCSYVQSIFLALFYIAVSKWIFLHVCTGRHPLFRHPLFRHPLFRHPLFRQSHCATHSQGKLTK